MRIISDIEKRTKEGVELIFVMNKGRGKNSRLSRSNEELRLILAEFDAETLHTLNNNNNWSICRRILLDEFDIVSRPKAI